MKKLNINTNSWHYELYKKYTFSDSVSNYPNLCQYIRGVFRGILLASFLVGLAVLTFILVSEPFLMLGMWLLHDYTFVWGFWTPNENIVFIFDVVLLLISTAMAIEYYGNIGLKKIKTTFGNNVSPKIKQTSFGTLLIEWYKQKKDKICLNVNFIEDKK